MNEKGARKIYGAAPTPVIRKSSVIRTAGTCLAGALLIAVSIVLPGCHHDLETHSMLHFQCQGAVDKYASTAVTIVPPLPTKPGSSSSYGAWVVYDSTGTKSVHFYGDRQYGPAGKNPMLNGSLLLQLSADDNTVSAGTDVYYGDYFLKLDLRGRDVDRFWIGFDTRVHQLPTWLTANFEKVSPDKFVLSSEGYTVYLDPGVSAVRYQLWQPRVSVVSFVSNVIHLGGNNGPGVAWADIGKVGSQYLVFVRMRPSPNMSGYVETLDTIKVEVQAVDASHISSVMLEQGEDEAMEEWLQDSTHSKYRQDYDDGLIDVFVNPASCTCPSSSVSGALVSKATAQLSPSGAAINGWPTSSSATINSSKSYADVEVVGQGTARTHLKGNIEFFLGEDSNARIGGFSLWGYPVTLSDGTNVAQLTVGQNATIRANCADGLPTGEFRLCSHYQIPAGAEPGFKAGAAAKVDGDNFAVVLANTQPLDLTVDFNGRTFTMQGGPLEGAFGVNGHTLTARITLNLVGEFVNLAPVARADETNKVYECGDLGRATVTLDASASSTQLGLGSISSYKWAEDVGSLTETPVGSGVTISRPMAFGRHNLTLFVTDTLGVTSSTDFAVDVVDTRIDALSYPPDRWVLQQDASGAFVGIGNATASDICSGQVLIGNDAPSNGHFPPGFSAIRWTIDDQHGNLLVHPQRVFVLQPQFFPPPNSETTVDFPTLSSGGRQKIRHRTIAQGATVYADEYVVLRAPNGSVSSVDNTGHLSTGVKPHRTNTSFGATTVTALTFDGYFSGNVGHYWIETSLVAPGADPVDASRVLARSWSSFDIVP